MSLIQVLPLMAAPPEGGQDSNIFMSLLPFIVIIVIFYFLFIRPQQKQQKKHQEMISALQKGNRVMTSGGLIGTVVGVQEETITLRFGEGFKAEVGKSYITGKVEG